MLQGAFIPVLGPVDESGFQGLCETFSNRNRYLKMKPYEQGALDGLCAVYSIVNATRLVSGIGDEDAKELFKEIVRYLETRKDLGKILIEGIDLLTIGGILGEVVGDKIKNRSMPFKQNPETPLDVFWTEMMSFINGGGKRAILIGVGGPMWDHWSIVESITEKQIRFFDSYKLKRLNRNRCGTTRSTSSRPHLLHPTHTYFLS